MYSYPNASLPYMWERYYDRRTVRYLEEMERKLQSSTVHLQEVGKVLELME